MEASQPSIEVEPIDGVRGVSLRGLDPALMSGLRAFQRCGGALETVLRVTVATSDGYGVAGRFRLVDTDLRFVPHFPFETGIPYQAVFDPGVLRACDTTAVVTLAFSLSRQTSEKPLKVEQMFPSGDDIPENLLRFYVCFSHPMERGSAEREVRLLGPDDHPVADALYRPPVELWDSSKRVLTILLDPGRLKRGVGPNRELGPPLASGRAYTLVVGEGMTDRFGRRLGAPVLKRFTVSAAIREPVDFAGWTLQPPEACSRNPIIIEFPAALDWAMTFNHIHVTTTDGAPVQGSITIGSSERQWRFTPSADWHAGTYQARVNALIEDPCGNTLLAAFDRPLTQGSDRSIEAEDRLLCFAIA